MLARRMHMKTTWMQHRLDFADATEEFNEQNITENNISPESSVETDGRESENRT